MRHTQQIRVCTAIATFQNKGSYFLTNSSLFGKSCWHSEATRGKHDRWIYLWRLSIRIPWRENLFIKSASSQGD